MCYYDSWNINIKKMIYHWILDNAYKIFLAMALLLCLMMTLLTGCNEEEIEEEKDTGSIPVVVTFHQPEMKFDQHYWNHYSWSE